jgi:hypothetical protein
MKRPLSSSSGAAFVSPPRDFRVGQSPRAGSLQLDATRQCGAIAYEIHTMRGDPALNEGWKQALIVPSVRRVVVDHVKSGPTWA